MDEGTKSHAGKHLELKNVTKDWQSRYVSTILTVLTDGPGCREDGAEGLWDVLPALDHQDAQGGPAQPQLYW